MQPLRRMPEDNRGDPLRDSLLSLLTHARTAGTAERDEKALGSHTSYAPTSAVHNSAADPPISPPITPNVSIISAYLRSSGGMQGSRDGGAQQSSSSSSRETAPVAHSAPQQSTSTPDARRAVASPPGLAPPPGIHGPLVQRYISAADTRVHAEASATESRAPRRAPPPPPGIVPHPPTGGTTSTSGLGAGLSRFPHTAQIIAAAGEQALHAAVSAPGPMRVPAPPAASAEALRASEIDSRYTKAFNGMLRAAAEILPSLPDSAQRDRPAESVAGAQPNITSLPARGTEADSPSPFSKPELDPAIGASAIRAKILSSLSTKEAPPSTFVVITDEGDTKPMPLPQAASVAKSAAAQYASSSPARRNSLTGQAVPGDDRTTVRTSAERELDILLARAMAASEAETRPGGPAVVAPSHEHNAMPPPPPPPMNRPRRASRVEDEYGSAKPEGSSFQILSPAGGVLPDTIGSASDGSLHRPQRRVAHGGDESATAQPGSQETVSVPVTLLQALMAQLEEAKALKRKKSMRKKSERHLPAADTASANDGTRPGKAVGHSPPKRALTGGAPSEFAVDSETVPREKATLLPPSATNGKPAGRDAHRESSPVRAGGVQSTPGASSTARAQSQVLRTRSGWKLTPGVTPAKTAAATPMTSVKRTPSSRSINRGDGAAVDGRGVRRTAAASLTLDITSPAATLTKGSTSSLPRARAASPVGAAAAEARTSSSTDALTYDDAPPLARTPSYRVLNTLARAAGGAAKLAAAEPPSRRRVTTDRKQPSRLDLEPSRDVVMERTFDAPPSPAVETAPVPAPPAARRDHGPTPRRPSTPPSAPAPPLTWVLTSPKAPSATEVALRMGSPKLQRAPSWRTETNSTFASGATMLTEDERRTAALLGVPEAEFAAMSSAQRIRASMTNREAMDAFMHDDAERQFEFFAPRGARIGGIDVMEDAARRRLEALSL